MISGTDGLGRWWKRLVVLGAGFSLLQFGGCSLESIYFSIAQGVVQSIAVEVYAAMQELFLTALGGQAGV